MAQFCTACGAALNGGNRFCPACGSAVLAATPNELEPEVTVEPTPVVTPEPVAPVDPALEPAYTDYAEPVPSGMSARTKSLLLGAGVAGALGVAAFVAFGLGGDKTDAELTNPAATASALASEDPNAPRPQAWFDSYTDKFLSAEIERLTIGAAQKRSFPTAKGGAALGPVARGTLVKGRWVEGGDPKTRWLKTADGGYVWEGNLGDPQQITALGMNGFVAGSSFTSVRDRINPEGHYGSQDPDMDTNACETYSSLDGLVSIMVVEGKVSRIATDNERLETGRGIRVGSSERELQRAYSNQLKREPNVYDGTDYYLWTSKDRGIRFLVNEGKVTWITSGDETIRYVEGCL